MNPFRRGTFITDARIKRLSLATFIIWTLLLTLSLGWYGFQVEESMVESTRIQARSNYMKDVVYRRWNSIHGGVYAPVTDWTPPNPYLSEMAERDIQTPSGRRLTKVNPAYMTRQAFELGLKEYGLIGHITSLNPIRPENAPDPWEAEALRSFEKGIKEVDTIEISDGKQFLRLMRPLITEQSCLSCHARQGYRLNEIRGGISVAVPMQPFQAIAANRKAHMAWIHAVLWLMGGGGILFAALRLDKSQSNRNQAEARLRDAYADLERQIAARTSELKLANEVLQEEVLERCRTTQALEKSDLQLRTAVRAANVGLWDWDLRTGKVFYSLEWKRQIGFEEDEITEDYTEWRSRLHPDDLERAIQAVDLCLNDPSSEYKAEFRLRHKNGSYRWIMVQGAPICDDNGKPIRMLGAHVDITERKTAEERLRRSEAHLAAAQRVAKIGSWELDVTANTGTWSEGMFRITGFDPSHGTPPLPQFMEMIHPDDRMILNNLHHRLLATGGNEQVEFRSRPDRGTIRYFLTNAEGERNEQGRTIKMMGTLQDITERKLASEALMAEKKKFQALIDESPFAVALIDQNQHFKYLNPRFEAVFGYGLKDFTTRYDWFEHAYPDPAYRRKVMASWQQAEEYANPGMIRNQTWQVRCKDESDKWVQISTAFLTNGEKIVTYEDVTEHRRMEEQLRHSQKMEAIGTLAGGIAHDFNNILAAILGYAEIVKEDTPPESETADHIGEVIRAALRARNLVQHILDFSRKSKPEKSPIALHLIVKEVVSLLRAAIPATISFNQEVASSGMILADSNQMHQMVMNLCTNACQAMQMKDGTLGIGLKPITLAAEEVMHYPGLSPGAYVQLSVSDTGCGMTHDIISRVFDPYFTTKPRGHGTGLGLSVIHGIVKSHGGAVTVYSEPGKGSIFHVYLPLIESDPGLNKEISEEPLPVGSERILFVDDEPALAELGKKLLTGFGYQVETRTNGSEVLEVMRETPHAFDLLITDMTMPYMSGVELAGKVLRIRPDLPIILCTGFSHTITAPKAKAMGIRELALKPLIRSELAILVRKVLDENFPTASFNPLT